MTKEIQKNREIIKKLSSDEIKKEMKYVVSGLDATNLLKQAYEDTAGFKKIQKFDRESSIYQAMTLYEFDKGMLMCDSLPEKYRVFALEFSKNLQIELKCEKKHEQSLAEICAINFVRVVEVENRISSYLGIGSITDMGVRYLAVLSKELDRAQRHYLTALQTLRMLKTPSLEINIKTQTAVIGQNQIVQTNNK